MPTPLGAAIDLWLFDLATFDARVEARAREVLHMDERAAFARFASSETAAFVGLRRGLLRLVLSAYSGQSAEDLAIATTPLEKPFLRGGPAFSTSRSDSCAVIAVGAAETSLGVDLEQKIDTRRANLLAVRALTAAERESLPPA